MPSAADRETRFAPRRTALGHGELAWREAGQGTALVLLHGIGAGSGSWVGQLEGLASSFRVIAWDAPGYGASAPLPQAQPLAGDYARVLAEFLQALKIDALALVGHSLGTIMAAAWAARPTAKLRRLVLASPARGYAQATPEARAAKYRERIELVERLGIEGMAAQRAARLCAPGAAADAIEIVRRNMARCTPGGYAQAAHMLANDDLALHLGKVGVPTAVLCGELDSVTPPAACKQVADDAGAPFTLLPGAGHACYVEDARRFNAALLDFIGRE